MTWFEAKDHCEGEGGKLMEIDSEEENTALAEEINRRGYTDKNMNFWIGLTDARHEGDWRLASTGLEPTFLKWHEGQPDNYWNEDCARFRTSGPDPMFPGRNQWFDIKCNVKDSSGSFPVSLHALCEFDIPVGKPSTEDAATETPTTEGVSNLIFKKGPV